jgi:hypothetical protein
MKILLLLGIVLTNAVFAAPKCSFIRNQFIEIEGKDIPKELKNKLLNNFVTDRLIPFKENAELGVSICLKLHPFHDKKDVLPQGAKDKEEFLLTKVKFFKHQGFWKIDLESFLRSKNGELTSYLKSEEHTAPKKIDEIKDVDVVDWVTAKIIGPRSK